MLLNFAAYVHHVGAMPSPVMPLLSRRSSSSSSRRGKLPETTTTTAAPTASGPRATTTTAASGGGNASTRPFEDQDGFDAALSFPRVVTHLQGSGGAAGPIRAPTDDYFVPSGQARSPRLATTHPAGDAQAARTWLRANAEAAVEDSLFSTASRLRADVPVNVRDQASSRRSASELGGPGRRGAIVVKSDKKHRRRDHDRATNAPDASHGRLEIEGDEGARRLRAAPLPLPGSRHNAENHKRDPPQSVERRGGDDIAEVVESTVRMLRDPVHRQRELRDAAWRRHSSPDPDATSTPRSRVASGGVNATGGWKSKLTEVRERKLDDRESADISSAEEPTSADMLTERLLELKAEALRAARTSTFLPQRLATMPHRIDSVTEIERTPADAHPSTRGAEAAATTEAAAAARWSKLERLLDLDGPDAKAHGPPRHPRGGEAASTEALLRSIDVFDRPPMRRPQAIYDDEEEEGELRRRSGGGGRLFALSESSRAVRGRVATVAVADESDQMSLGGGGVSSSLPSPHGTPPSSIFDGMTDDGRPGDEIGAEGRSAEADGRSDPTTMIGVDDDDARGAQAASDISHQYLHEEDDHRVDVEYEKGDAAPTPPSSLSSPVFLARAVQRAGLCSRREAFDLVASGDVRVNHRVERNPFAGITADDDLHVRGHSGRLRFAPSRLWMFHKPAYVSMFHGSRSQRGGEKDASPSPSPSLTIHGASADATSARLHEKRHTLFTKFARVLGVDHVIPVGSLPTTSHGVVLLTNDGDLARYLTSAESRIQSTYIFRVVPPIDPLLAHRLNMEGVRVNGVLHRGAEFTVFGHSQSRNVVKVKLRGIGAAPLEGTTASMMGSADQLSAEQLIRHLGRKIIRGRRVSFGPYTLQSMGPGAIKEVTVPPFFQRHTAEVWRPFIERDWPFYRKQRAVRLKRLSKFRVLNEKERDELNAMTYEELRKALMEESTEVQNEADYIAERLASRPAVSVFGGQFVSSPRGNDDDDQGQDGHSVTGDRVSGVELGSLEEAPIVRL